MGDDFGSDYITITDGDGNEFELEVLDTIEFEGQTYTVFLPADIETMDVNDPDYGIVILRNSQENGEETYDSVDDEDELNRVYEYYMQLVDDEAENKTASDGESKEE